MPGIIVGIDGSARSRQALEWAVNEAAVRQAPLTVLTVSEALAGGRWGGPAYPGDLDRIKQAQEVAQVETDKVLKKAGGASKPASVTVRAVTGVPADQLLNAAKDADMLVIGSRGADGFKHLLLGSVSTHITHHAHCPVIVIPTDNA
jgi:nucleotide-binding universal stress UspA family protein